MGIGQESSENGESGAGGWEVGAVGLEIQPQILWHFSLNSLPVECGLYLAVCFY